MTLLISLVSATHDGTCFVDVKDETVNSHITVECCENIGTFSIGKFYDEGYSITYNYPNPWKGTYLAIKVDGKVYSNSICSKEAENLDGYVTEYPGIVDESIVTQWSLAEGIIVWQILDGVDDGAVIRVKSYNGDTSSSHEVEVRLVIDTSIAGVDEGIVYTLGNETIRVEKAVDVSSLANKTLTIQDRIYNPVISATLNLKPTDNYKGFDKIGFINWKTARSMKTWEYQMNTLETIESDSCLILYTHPITLSPGESTEAGMRYIGKLVGKPTCFDEIKNQGEIDIDCGGPCHPCAINKHCLTYVDCTSGYCENNTCEKKSVDMTHTSLTISPSKPVENRDSSIRMIATLIILLVIATIALTLNKRIEPAPGGFLVIFLILGGLWMITTIPSDNNPDETTTTLQPPKIHYLGILPSRKPSALLKRFTGIEKYLCDETGMEIRLKLYPTGGAVGGYTDVVRDITKGDISFAFLSPSAIVQAHEVNNRVHPFVCAQNNGSPTYQGHIVVRVDSPYEDIEDLEGKPVCGSTASSTSGNLMPTAFLLKKGINKTAYFKPFIFLGAQDKAVEALITGRVEAAFINEMLFHEYNLDSVRLRSIYRHPAVPGYSFTVNTEKVTPEELAKVNAALLTMHEVNPEAIKAVEPGYDKWVSVKWENYLGMKVLIDKIYGPIFYDLDGWQGNKTL